MKNRGNTKKKKVCEGWRVIVETVGTPGQQEKALRQAARYVLSCLAGRKNPPPPRNLG